MASSDPSPRSRAESVDIRHTVERPTPESRHRRWASALAILVRRAQREAQAQRPAQSTRT